MTRKLTVAAASLALFFGFASPAEAGAYLRLSEIAERYGLAADVDLLTGRHVLTDGQNRIAVVPGVYQILVNGRFVGLEERVGTDQGDLIVPAAALPFIDANLVRRPAISASTVPASLSGGTAELRPQAAPVTGRAGTIVIDPGHGGVHTGARGRSGIYEKDVTLAISRQLKSMLETRGWRVVLTREGDRQLNSEINADLDARVALANRSGAGLFVSIHANYAESSTAQGFEVYCSPGRPRDAELARSIERGLRANVNDEDRGVKTAGFRVIKHAAVPAVLVEVGFVSNPATERRLATEMYRRKIAEAICSGILRYSEGRGR